MADPPLTEKAEEGERGAAKPRSDAAAVAESFLEVGALLLREVIVAWLVAVVVVLLRDLVLAPVAALGLLVAIQLSLGLWIQWVLLAVLMVYSAWAVRSGGFWRQWLPWLRPGRTWISPVLDAYRSLFVLTASFAGLTTILAAQGVLGTDPPFADDGSVWPALAYYVWHFLDAIPVLEIPATLNWSLGTDYTGYTSGVLLLVYKLLVIVPVVRAILEVVQRTKERASQRAPAVRTNGSH